MWLTTKVVSHTLGPVGCTLPGAPYDGALSGDMHPLVARISSRITGTRRLSGSDMAEVAPGLAARAGCMYCPDLDSLQYAESAVTNHLEHNRRESGGPDEAS